MASQEPPRGAAPAPHRAKVTTGTASAAARANEPAAPDTALEPLSEQDCLALLKRVKYGRVAVVTKEGRPEIFPVNFALHGHTVVFLTGSSVMQERAPLGHVAFEADEVEPATHEGWDVVVSGEGADITDSVDELSLIARSDLVEQWAPGRKDRWISIVNPRFSGRRLYVPAPAPTFF